LKKFILILIVSFNALSFWGEENPALNNFRGTRGNGLNFTPNKGQIVDAENNLRPDIFFVGDGGGAKVYLRKTGISYVISDLGSIMGTFRKLYKKELRMKHLDKKLIEIQNAYIKSHPVTVQRVDVEFEGANSTFEVVNEEEIEGYSNYYYPQCPNGITSVNSFNK